MSDSDSAFMFCHPELLATAYEAAKACGWSKEKQKSRIVYALKRKNIKDTAHKTIDEISSDQLLPPTKIADPKTTVRRE